MSKTNLCDSYDVSLTPLVLLKEAKMNEFVQQLCPSGSKMLECMQSGTKSILVWKYWIVFWTVQSMLFFLSFFQAGVYIRRMTSYIFEMPLQCPIIYDLIIYRWTTFFPFDFYQIHSEQLFVAKSFILFIMAVRSRFIRFATAKL